MVKMSKLAAENSAQRTIKLSNATFRAFTEQLCHVHSDWSLRDPHVDRLSAEFRQERLGDIGFTDVKVGFGLAGARGREQISHLTDNFYGVILMLQGGQRLVQGYHEVDLQPGDISVWNASEPADFSSSGPVRQISVLVPHAKLKLYSNNIEDVCAQRISGRSGLGLLLASHLNALSEVLPEMDECGRAAAETATLDLISATIRPATASEFKSSVHKSLHRQVQTYIVNNLRNPELSPQVIADSFKVSLRYLHKLFEPTDFSVSEWVLERRLIACRSALSDPALNHMTITQIAYNWGFSNAAYFSRVFKSRFGRSPRDYRQCDH